MKKTGYNKRHFSAEPREKLLFDMSQRGSRSHLVIAMAPEGPDATLDDVMANVRITTSMPGALPPTLDLHWHDSKIRYLVMQSNLACIHVIMHCHRHLASTILTVPSSTVVCL